MYNISIINQYEIFKSIPKNYRQMFFY